MKINPFGFSRFCDFEYHVTATPLGEVSIWKQQPLPKTEQGLSKASNDVPRMNGENVVTVLDLFVGLS